jgi:hypothetical protein
MNTSSKEIASIDILRQAQDKYRDRNDSRYLSIIVLAYLLAAMVLYKAMFAAGGSFVGI